MSVANADAAAVAAITAELVTLGIPSSMIDNLLQAVDNAGYDVVPKIGGGAVPVGTSLASTAYAIDGYPSLYVVEVTLPSTTVISRIMTRQEMRGEVGQGAQTY